MLFRSLRALWKQIIRVSVTDLKENYRRLNVDFDVWYGESDAQPFIPPMIERMKEEGYARESQGALVVDVAEETDTKEVPPCILVKSDGATLYATTDLATIVQRVPPKRRQDDASSRSARQPAWPPCRPRPIRAARSRCV